jgi:eukaryotic-like serine/threonine-protein kinase
MRFRPELALTRLQLAELILDHYPDEKKEAVEHLAFCIPEFRDMKMKPWLERALSTRRYSRRNMKCPKCNTENSDSAKFCRKCGQSSLTALECSYCHHTNKLDSEFCEECGKALTPLTPPLVQAPPTPDPTSFVDGRYQVKKFLGEGGKKKVYLAYDTLLDRDVAFALIKTEKLDDAARIRVSREAKAMGKLGDHPNVVTIHDMGEHEGQPYIVPCHAWR